MTVSFDDKIESAREPEDSVNQLTLIAIFCCSEDGRGEFEGQLNDKSVGLCSPASSVITCHSRWPNLHAHLYPLEL